MLTHLDNISPPLLADPVIRSHPLNRGRVAWWIALPNLSGGQFLHDLMGLYPATLTSMGAGYGWMPTTRPGGYGQLLGNGTSSRLAVSPFPYNLSSGTYAAWIKSTSLSTQSVIDRSRGTSFGGTCYMNAGSCGLEQSDYTAKATSNYTAHLDGNWHRIIGRFSGTGGLSEVSFWVDGIKRGTLAMTTANVSGNGVSGGAWMACTGNGAGLYAQFFNGALDDVSYWNRGLSDQEIAQDYNLSRTGYPGVLNRWYGGQISGASGGSAWTMTLTESYAIADSRLASAGKALPETFTLSDARSASLLRLLAESYALADARTSGPGKAVADGYALSDVRAASAGKSLPESYAITDTRAAAAVRALIESLSFTDARSARAGKVMPEAYALADVRVMAVAKALIETLPFADTRTASLARILSETLSLIDTRTSGTAWSKILAETYALSDLRTSGPGKGLTESYSLADIRSAAVQKMLLETLVLTDTRLSGIARQLAETYNLTDAAAAQIVVAAMFGIITVGNYADTVTIGQGGIA